MSEKTDKPTFKPCNCWEEYSKKLEEKGFKFRKDLTNIAVTKKMDLVLQHILPIATLQDRKPARGQPEYLVMSHCPFCGKPFNAPKEVAGAGN